MQRCPYIHEMRERLLGPQTATAAGTTTTITNTTTATPSNADSPLPSDREALMNEQNRRSNYPTQQPLPPLPPHFQHQYPHQLPPTSSTSSPPGSHHHHHHQQQHHPNHHPQYQYQPISGNPTAAMMDNSNQVGTVVKLNSDGYGSHTSPAHQRTPLVPRDLGEDFSLDYSESEPLDPRKPKNANTIIYGRYVQEKKRTSLFIITSLVYAMLLIVVCVAYVISDVATHQLPIIYYEGFFTYLYGASILFLLYVFCFLLQESTCCSGGGGTPKQPAAPKPVKQKKPKKEKSKKSEKGEAAAAAVAAGGDNKEKFEKEKGGGGGKDAATAAAAKGGSGKPSPFQEVLPKKKRDLVRERLLQQDSTSETAIVEVAAATPKNVRKRKTTHTDPSHGSFFLRVGAIAFGLGTMIYVGLEIGTFFETPFTSPCHQILRGVNPLLQMIFTFMQMYFIFMNSRLNIHRFKVLARFGLMHICATNICVWIRTLVLESLKEITLYHQGSAPNPNDGAILETIRTHSLRHAGTVMGTNYGPDSDWEPLNLNIRQSAVASSTDGILSRMVHTTARAITVGLQSTLGSISSSTPTSTITTTTVTAPTTTTDSTSTMDSSLIMNKLKKLISSSSSTTEFPSSISTTSASSIDNDDSFITSPRSIIDFLTTTATTTTTSTTQAPPPSSTPESIFNNLFSGMENALQYTGGLVQNQTADNSERSFESLDSLFPMALVSNNGGGGGSGGVISGIISTAFPSIASNTSCGRVNIMGTIVQDSAPYLYPFIIEYSLIGAVVIYVMWKHIGRYPKYTEEDLEHRLEVMLSRRAVAMAQAHSGRVDCVGASKGLFFGLLLLVGSLICLILFFVLVRHNQFSLLAIYLADASHCALMAFAVFAIFVGFIRVQTLKFRCEEQSNLNDILLRISAFGLFIYAVFSVIAGSLNAFESEPNLLVMVTGLLAVAQVVLQLLFIGDVSRRRVHLPEHDRSKPGRQIVTFLLICNIAMFAIYTFEAQKVFANPVQLDFYGFIAWSLIQRVTLPLCIFHRFHSAVTLAEIWKTTYKARLE